MNESNNPFGSASTGSPSGGQSIERLKREVAEEELSQLNVEIPKSLHKRLKIHCLETEQDMRDVVRRLLENHLSD